eukprot:gene769-61_t
MVARKFTDSQLALLELEFNAGLNSTSEKQFGDRMRRLADRSGLPESTIKVWINNRKRGPPPTCFPSSSTDVSGSEVDKASRPKKPLKAPCISRKPSGYNLFVGELFSNELRGLPNAEKNVIASKKWQDMDINEKMKWNDKVKQLEKPSLEDLSDIQRKKLIDATLKRIDEEMQNLSQYGGRGVALMLRPYDNKVVMSSTVGDEEFLLANRDILKEFSLFTTNKNVSAAEVTVKAIQSMLNNKYRQCFDRVNVEYSKSGIKFHVDGWPAGVPFRQPSRLGGTQLKKIWDNREVITFRQNTETTIADREGNTLEDDAAPQDGEETQGEEDLEEHAEEAGNWELEEAGEEWQVDLSSIVKRKRAKANSLVKKDDVIPVLAPENVDTKFWLFICASKCKTDGCINGKWLDRIGETYEYRVLPIKASTRESCILWNAAKNRREVLADDCFEIKDAKRGIFLLTPASQNHLISLAELQILSSETV